MAVAVIGAREFEKSAVANPVLNKGQTGLSVLSRAMKYGAGGV